MLDPLKARVVREAFEMRRRGDSQGVIAKYMEGELGRRYSKNAVGAILRNATYLGTARGPFGAVNEGTHEAIVDPDLFRAAQAVKGSTTRATDRWRRSWCWPGSSAARSAGSACR